ncbi:heme ABC transporter ATP-binding protein [Pelagibacterium luteolum]|uniref:Iron complex transport system ATP-binding protein n=1 Tax=Pelagibacterium luteolum TaxID=440168 RepID=A0A1G7YK65_9HYPH|nr:heme ABC transporter ATP-binding protein [Pelagibacterium luteolum]SDG96726.1 iron complex transport system ATP-binding protein [Pelagibacterium luteolum]
MSLVAHNISLTIDGRALLRQVSLDVRRGEVLGLLGPNGSGKTTLLRALSGELVPTSGEVRLLAQDIRDIRLKEQARHRAVMPQNSNTSFGFRSWDIVLMGRHAHIGRNGETMRDYEVVHQCLHRTDTAKFADRIYPTLSGGERSRVTLARALAQETTFLLLDEPTASLDPLHQRQVLELARNLAAEGCGVLTILHDLNLASAFCDRVGILNRGELVVLNETDKAMAPETLEKVFGTPFLKVHVEGRARPAFVMG